MPYVFTRICYDAGHRGVIVRVLIVDDYPDIVEAMAALLTQLGHDCRTAGTAAEALAVVETFEPELALLDVGLPDLSGYELLDALRTWHGHQPPYFVALTGWHEAHRDAVGGGFNHCLLKPATLAQLVAAIALAEAHSSATAAHQQADACPLPIR